MKNTLRFQLIAGAVLSCTLLSGCNAGIDIPLLPLAKTRQNVAAPEFQGLDNWFNSAPLSMQELRGKVVLVDFWTFDCINCLNHMPYVQDWYRKYKDQGLVVVGIHTPEFAYEKSAKSVQSAITKLGIEHPVAQDNDYKTWRAFHNQYWPAIYLIDKNGQIVYSHFGEGRYGETENRIQGLLAEPALEQER